MKTNFTPVCKLASAILLCFLFELNTASAQALKQTAVYTRICAAIGGYYECLPPDYATNTSKKYPLLVFLHGAGDMGDGSPAQLPRVLGAGTPMLIDQGSFPSTFTVNNQTFSFIVITPQMGSDTRNARIVDTLIDYVVQKYRVDPARIYLTGTSMGGGLSWLYAGSKEFADRLAALAVVCGNTSAADGLVSAVAEANTPVWAFHNDGDPTVPSSYTKDWIRKLNAYSPPVNPAAKGTIYPANTHDAWTTSFNPSYRENGKNMYEWMLSYSSTTTTPPPASPPATGSKKYIKVNVYGGSNPYNNSEWNNWNIGSSGSNISTGALHYSTGTASAVKATLSQSTGVGDNSASYQAGMAPAEVLRHTSYSTVGRSLTISGLSPSLKYDIELYASRNTRSGNSTVFSIGSLSTAVATHNNFSDKAVFTGIVPNAQGQITVTLKRTQTYTYLNGFTITEGSGAATSVNATGTVTQDLVTGENNLSATDEEPYGQPLYKVYPNPVQDGFVLQVNNDKTGTMTVQVLDLNGVIRKDFKLNKDQRSLSRSLSIGNLPAGTYVIRSQIQDWTEAIQIIKL